VFPWLGMFTSDELTALTLGGIQLSEQGLVLLVRASKPDQAGEGLYVFWVMCGMLRCARCGRLIGWHATRLC